MTGPAEPSRSFVLLAVLAVMGSALLVATSLLFLAQAEVAGATHTRDRAQSRLLAWSGIQAVMQRLGNERQRILDGDVPDLDAEYVIYETDDAVGIVRLIPDATGALITPEAGKLDLNTADAAELAATEVIDESLAAAIIEYRDERRGGALRTVAELLRVPGVTPEVLYGPLDELADYGEVLGAGQDVGERITERFARIEARAEPRGLVDVVTVYAVEPALQRNGKLRINLNVEWSDELARRVDDRWGEGASGILEQVFDRGTRFDTDAAIIEVLRSFGLDPEQWPEYVDALTTDAGDYHYGRVDINTARPETLAALPGIGAEAAAQIVRTREALGADERATIAWPAIERIVTPEAYDDLAGRITTRCWTYRLRLVAGERIEGDDAEDAKLHSPVVYEVVIDLADPRPRVAYLRDVSLLPTATKLAVSVAGDETGLRRDDRRRRDEDEREPATTAPDEVDPADGWTMDTDLDFGGDSFDLGGDSFDPGGDAFDFGGDLDFGGDEGTEAESEPSMEDAGSSSPESGGSSRRRRIGRWLSD
ncbi:MAG: helix-hairpin-helix domain-containing protein [Planctomycetes bacterium]|nr:helix-hairpin-helix domain-containing protein [Planctomycetota bacterium]